MRENEGSQSGKEERLQEIASRVEECRKCPLYKGADQAVPGEGDPDAEIMFIGEAPGKQEDKEGVPFVGRAGKLLDQFLKILEKGREQVFIANVIKHRPENNRDPRREEIEACQPYLEKQIAVIDPDVIVTLGNFALEFILNKRGISNLHGKVKEKRVSGQVRRVFPMYHPAASIYNRDLRPTLEQDFRKLGRILQGGKSAQSSIGNFG